MWERKGLKSKAKEMLSKHYWKAFIVMLITSILGANSFKFDFSSIGQNPVDTTNYNVEGLTSTLGSALIPWFLLMLSGLIIVIVAVGLFYKFFIAHPLEVGKSSFFVECYNSEEPELVTLFSTFKKGYMNAVKALFFRSLYVFLWSLLLIIPGIMKSYAYRFLPYIMAENPYMHYKEALDISTSMTDGQKMNIFILDISFIGWYILGGIAFGIGVLFVHPYHEATIAALYFELKEHKQVLEYD